MQRLEAFEDFRDVVKNFRRGAAIYLTFQDPISGSRIAYSLL